MGGIVFHPPQPGRGIHTATAWPQSPGVYQGMGPALTGEAGQPDARAPTSLQSPSPHDKLRNLLDALRTPIGTESTP